MRILMPLIAVAFFAACSSNNEEVKEIVKTQPVSTFYCHQWKGNKIEVPLSRIEISGKAKQREDEGNLENDSDNW